MQWKWTIRPELRFLIGFALASELILIMILNPLGLSDRATIRLVRIEPGSADGATRFTPPMGIFRIRNLSLHTISIRYWEEDDGGPLQPIFPGYQLYRENRWEHVANFHCGIAISPTKTLFPGQSTTISVPLSYFVVGKQVLEPWTEGKMGGRVRIGDMVSDPFPIDGVTSGTKTLEEFGFSD